MADEFLEVAALTDVGSVRQYNEDSIAVDLVHGILALADGMGGHRAGEVASRMATETLLAGLAAAARSFRRKPAPACPTACAGPKHKSSQPFDSRGRAAGHALPRHGHHPGGGGIPRQPGDPGARRRLAHLSRPRPPSCAPHARRFASARPGGARRDHGSRSEPIAQSQPRHARARHRGAGQRAHRRRGRLARRHLPALLRRSQRPRRRRRYRAHRGLAARQLAARRVAPRSGREGQWRLRQRFGHSRQGEGSVSFVGPRAGSDVAGAGSLACSR